MTKSILLPARVVAALSLLVVGPTACGQDDTLTTETGGAASGGGANSAGASSGGAGNGGTAASGGIGAGADTGTGGGAGIGAGGGTGAAAGTGAATGTGAAAGTGGVGSGQDGLLWESGFEPATTLSLDDGFYQYFSGTDATTGDIWDGSNNFYGSGSGLSGSNGIHVIHGGDKPRIDNHLETVTGRLGGSTTALYQATKYNGGATSVTQIPYQLNDIVDKQGDEWRVSFWIKIDTHSMPNNWDYRVLWEYKSDYWYTEDGNTAQEGFRGIAFIYRRADGVLCWRLDGDDNPGKPRWQIVVPETSVAIPRGVWFKLDFYGRWSSGTDGVLGMMVNDKVIAEKTGERTLGASTSDSAHYMMWWQLYGCYPCHQWIDDVKLFNQIPH